MVRLATGAQGGDTGLRRGDVGQPEVNHDCNNVMTRIAIGKFGQLGFDLGH